MTFLCIQANVDDLPDDEFKFFTLRTRVDTTTGMAFSIMKEGPLDDNQEHLWKKVSGIEEAETIVVNAILDRCERVDSIGHAITKIAHITRRGLGNIILLNPLDKGKPPNPIRFGGQFIYTEIVPEGTGIAIYKGNSEKQAIEVLL